MPTKFQLITELYDQTVQSVTGSYQSWTGFLRAACYNYKCPFDDQILIYAQRPDATAVLEMERWNRQFGRWVNRGAKSIAVLFNELVLSDKLFEHCAEIDEAARNRMELIVRSLAEQNGVTEQLKAENQMEWVRQMNACKAQAEEIVKAELIYD